MRFLWAVPSGKWVKVVSPSLWSSSLPEIGEVQAHVEAHRPVVILAFDRVVERPPLGMALDAGVVGVDVVEAGRIDDGLARAGCATCSLPGPWQRSQPTFHSVTVLVSMS